jgi:predicted kinase
LLLMHGLSGSGKTTISQYLLEQLPAIRIRSDIERKRLHGLAGDARTGAGIEQGIYDRAAGERTYQQLATLAGAVLDAGHSVIVDAAFLQVMQREPFIELAHARAVPCFIIDCQAPQPELRRRIAARQHDMKDASEAGIAVLENQLRHYQPLEVSEAGAVVIKVDSDAVDMGRLLTALHTSMVQTP